ncbi:hypothetical protein GJ744_010031 [Endocarpon pusillum]|uniref:Uncharacterized protein n=1 Tax=Endocarpon pusillum TaxID=364733 RepID=A0A8H7E3C5_9EURO|nr:hypothetical protein GJ744_010031 [Endocarpon pusillum]
MYGFTVTQRPKYLPLLTSRDSTIPINPSAIGELSNDDIKEYILDHEEIEEDKIIPQKIAANKRKVTKALQEEYDEWQQRNYKILPDIYFSCSVVI